MTKKQAKELKMGDIVTAIVESPTGGESHWNSKERQWIYKPIKVGQKLIFQRIIPKVRIVRFGPWNDGHDCMLFCQTLNGERAWLNIGNATLQ